MDYETKLHIFELMQNCEDKLFDSIKIFYKSRSLNIEENKDENGNSEIAYIIKKDNAVYNLTFSMKNEYFSIDLTYVDNVGKGIELYTFIFEAIDSNCKPYNFENDFDYSLSPYTHIEYEDYNLIEDFINIINSIE